MARIAVNGIHLNVEVWPSPPTPLPCAGEGSSPPCIGVSLSSTDRERRAGPSAVAEGPVSHGLSGEGILLLHGFTGAGDAWRAHTLALASYATVVAVDLIGHGRSDAPGDPARYSVERCVADLLAVLDDLGLSRVAVLGYSMGARVALSLAAAAPARVSVLILESGSPGLASAEERRARRDSDAALAARIERDGVERFVDYWEALPLFATQRRPPLAVQIVQRQRRLRNSATGLANSLRGMGTGAQTSLWDRLGEIHTPTLLIVGALDDKFRAIGGAMAAALPHARLAVVPDAGHAVHLEQPEEFDQLIMDFLQAYWPAAEVAGSVAMTFRCKKGNRQWL